jgi:hypothetical protein
MPCWAGWPAGCGWRYGTSWHDGIADTELVRLARDKERTVLGSDGDVFAFALVRDAVVSALFVPRGLIVQAQLAHVLRGLELLLREPRCMACGGQLLVLTREEAAGRVPPAAWRSTIVSGNVPAARSSSGTARTGSASSNGYERRRPDRPVGHAERAIGVDLATNHGCGVNGYGACSYRTGG